MTNETNAAPGGREAEYSNVSRLIDDLMMLIPQEHNNLAVAIRWKLGIAIDQAARSCGVAVDPIPQLMKFYNVETLVDLILAQDRHIEKLQAKLPKARDTEPRNPRAA
jgi:hypothetical protein